VFSTNIAAISFYQPGSINRPIHSIIRVKHKHYVPSFIQARTYEQYYSYDYAFCLSLQDTNEYIRRYCSSVLSPNELSYRLYWNSSLVRIGHSPVVCKWSAYRHSPGLLLHVRFAVISQHWLVIWLVPWAAYWPDSVQQINTYQNMWGETIVYGNDTKSSKTTSMYYLVTICNM
jgi:hypothetical protein